MSVLSIIEVSEGKIKKASYEAAYYASKVAESLSTDAVALVLGTSTADELANLGNYGIKKVLHANNARFDSFDSKAHTKAAAEAVTAAGATVVVLSFGPNGKLLGPRISVRLQAGYIPGANELPTFTGSDLHVSRNVFSGKAKASYLTSTDKKVIAVSPNSLSPVKVAGTATVEAFTSTLTDADFTTTTKSVDKVVGEVPLTEADIVVSAGRGLKGPENWGMIEELAHLLGAATACSRPVSDVDWRPHHEHVG